MSNISHACMMHTKAAFCSGKTHAMSSAQVRTCDLLLADGLPMLLKACHTTKPRVHAAFQVLFDLTDTKYMLDQQARDNTVSMAQLHGVHMLCNLLCPEVTPRHPALGAQGGLMPCANQQYSGQRADPSVQKLCSSSWRLGLCCCPTAYYHTSGCRPTKYHCPLHVGMVTFFMSIFPHGVITAVKSCQTYCEISNTTSAKDSPNQKQQQQQQQLLPVHCNQQDTCRNNKSELFRPESCCLLPSLSLYNLPTPSTPPPEELPILPEPTQ